MATADPRAQDIVTCHLCTNPVEFFCKPCHVRLCQECVVKHMLLQKSKNHNVVLFRERESKQILLSRCQKHTDMLCELHCKTCNFPICSKCSIGPHAKHAFTNLEKQMIEKMRTTIEAENTELEKIIIPTYEEKESEVTTEMSVRKQKYSSIQSDIDAHGEKWHNEIDTIIKKQKEVAKLVEEKDLDRLEKYQDELREMLSLARDVLKRNKDLLKSNNTTQIRNYKSRNVELKSFPSKIHWNFPSFIPINLQGEHLYRQFGKLNLSVESEIEGFKIKNLDTPEVSITIQTPKQHVWKLCHTRVDKIWIAGNECTMDLVDLQGTMLETVKTLSEKIPHCLTVSKEGHLVYGDYFNRQINLVQDGDTNTIITLSSPWTPRELCFTLSGDLLVAMHSNELNDNKIVQYDKDYKLKREIQYDDDGLPLINVGKKPFHVTENKNSDICVSDGNANCVVTVNQEGKLRWRYRGHKLSTVFTARGIATDSQCHVLVADCSHCCIHMTDKNGKFLLYIDNCNLQNPYSLSIDREDRLFVSENTAYVKNKVKVLKYLK